MKNKEKISEEEKKEKKEKKEKRKKKEEQILSFPKCFCVIGADLSLRCPGFCIIKVNDRNIENVRTYSLNNKSAKKTHGEILNEISKSFPEPDSAFTKSYYVREHAFNAGKAQAEMAIFKVVGVMDVALWNYDRKEWFEIYPVTVKKLITGSGKATKQEVAAGLFKYLGQREYKTDDESDAAAVAVAFLLQHGLIDVKEAEAHAEE